MMEAIGWFLMSCPVRLVYLANATLKRASKLDDVEVVCEADDMALRKMLDRDVMSGMMVRKRATAMGESGLF